MTPAGVQQTLDSLAGNPQDIKALLMPSTDLGGDRGIAIGKTGGTLASRGYKR